MKLVSQKQEWQCPMNDLISSASVTAAPQTQQAAENNSAEETKQSTNKNIKTWWAQTKELEICPWSGCLFAIFHVNLERFVCVFADFYFDFYFFSPIIVWIQESILLLLWNPLDTFQSCTFEQKSTDQEIVTTQQPNLWQAQNLAHMWGVRI